MTVCKFSDRGSHNKMLVDRIKGVPVTDEKMPENESANAPKETNDKLNRGG